MYCVLLKHSELLIITGLYYNILSEIDSPTKNIIWHTSMYILWYTDIIINYKISITMDYIIIVNLLSLLLL